MRRVLAIAALCTSIGALGATAGVAQEPTDPEASSPAGTVYEIPIDTARRDGAPRRGRRGGDGSTRTRRGGGDGATSGGSGGAGGTSIKSENYFGSSSQIPGLAGDGAGGDGSGGGGSSGDGGEGATGDRSGSDGSDGGSGGTGTGGGAGGAGSDPTAGGVDPATTLSPGGVSPAGGFALVALVVLLGGYVGLMAARGARRRAES